MMATDRNPASPYAGAVYFAWQDGRDDGNDIYFAASFDDGESFTEPVKLNDDGTDHAQFFPAISVSPGGVIDVTWMDRSLDPDDHFVDQTMTYSLDGGATWAPNFRVRDAADRGWDPELCHHQNGMIFLGDYIDMDSSFQAAHPVWPDTRLGVCDVFTATVLRPIFAEGWSDEARDEVLAWIAEHPVS
jgi:hypothetical protein